MRRRPAAGSALGADAHRGLAACLWQQRDRERDSRPRAHLCHRRRASSGKPRHRLRPGTGQRKLSPRSRVNTARRPPLDTISEQRGVLRPRTAPCPARRPALTCREGSGSGGRPGRAGLAERGGREGREHPCPSCTPLPPVSALRAGRGGTARPGY